MKDAVFIVNRPDYLLSHRLGLALSLRDAGYRVHIFSVPHISSTEIEKYGFVFHSVNMERGGTNPFRELISIAKSYLLIKQIAPEILHCITLKPVFYGAFISRLVKVPKLIVSVAGLGSVFTTNSIKNKFLRTVIVRFLKFGFYKRNVAAIFQNSDDEMFFVNNNIVEKSCAHIIPGAGVDLEQYSYSPIPNFDVQRVLLPARLIAEKGVFEYIEAARKILAERNDVEFLLAGELDFGNPSSLSQDKINQLKKIKGISFLGHCTDMKAVFEKSSIVVLPSYREGFPKALIEAAAIGRPIVTTDVPGCRDAVIPGVTGLLVPLKSVDELALKIEVLLNDRDMAQRFGLAAREFAEQNFDVHQVTATHREIYGLKK